MEYLSEYRRVNYYLGVAVNNDNIQIKMLNQE